MEQKVPWQRILDKFGMSQSALAKIVGVSRSTICRGITRKSDIEKSTRRKILRAAVPFKLSFVMEDFEIPMDLTGQSDA